MADFPTDPAVPVRSARADAGPVAGSAEAASLVPFAGGPALWRRALGTAWRTRGAWFFLAGVLEFGVCDVCPLGPRGRRDDAGAGVHFCARRFEGLERAVRPVLVPADLVDMGRLRRMDADGLRALGRLGHPYAYRRGEQGLRQVGWEEALALLGAAAPAHGAFLVGPQVTAEVAYALSRAARLLGSHDVALVGSAVSAVPGALRAALGNSRSTCSYRDLVGTDLVVVAGADDVRDFPMLAHWLARAKGLGARVVAVGPRRPAGLDAAWLPDRPLSALFGTRVLDDHVVVPEGGGAAFFVGVLKALAERGAVDEAFVAASTSLWPSTRRALDRWTWPAVGAGSGARRAEVEWLAELIARSRHFVSVLGDGLSRDDAGVLTDLHLARGAVGRERCGLLHLPVDAGGLLVEPCGLGPALLPGGRTLGSAAARQLAERWGVALPAEPGCTVPGIAQGLREGAVDWLFSVQAPLDALAADLGGARVRVHAVEDLDPLVLAEPGELLLLLPLHNRFEQAGGGLVPTPERRVVFSPEIPGHPRVREARAAWQVPGLVAEAVRPGLGAGWERASALRDEIEAVVEAWEGVGSLRLPGDHLQVGGPRLHAGGAFARMKQGRARFSLPGLSVDPSAVE